nr:hypothetical protein BgiMline_028257 [Biomphalaria glabrata]
MGNTISIVVFSRKTFQGSASTLSQQILCALETLYMGILTWGITIVHLKMTLSKPVCLALFYLMHVINVVCNWMVVLVTIERLTSVILPLRVRILWTRRRLLIVFFTISFLTLVLYSGLFILTTKLDNLVTNSSTVFACLTHYKDVKLEMARAWLEIIFMHSMPCAILVIGNGLIILCMGRHKAFLKKLTQKLPTVRRHAKLPSADLCLINSNSDTGQLELSSPVKTHSSPCMTRETHGSKKLFGIKTCRAEDLTIFMISKKEETTSFSSLDLTDTNSQGNSVASVFLSHQFESSEENQNQETINMTMEKAEPLNGLIPMTSPHLDLTIVMNNVFTFHKSTTKRTAQSAKSVTPRQPRKMSQQSQNGQLRKERAMTVTLLLINFTFLGTKTPYFIHSITLPGFPDKDAVLTLQEAELKLHFVILSSLFNALSFILYCLAGSKFREELSKMVCSAVNQVRGLYQTKYN